MSLVMRGLRKLRSSGLRAVAASASGRYAYWRHTQRATRPVAWARLGGASLLLARALKPAQPSVLILSLPRSGSTWVGEMLGSAANALYLREPFDGPATDGGFKYPFDSPLPEPPPQYGRLATVVFAACPAFDSRIVKHPAQWNLVHRHRRRLVIKEAHPRLCGWALAYDRPRLIFLVRHPAAIAASFRKLKWWSDDPAIWRHHGRHQGAGLRAALDALKDYAEYRIVLYEDLCAEPLKRFRELFDFAGMQWDSNIEEKIRGRSTAGDADNPWETSRDSRSMIGAWRPQVTGEQLAQLREEYIAFDLPWYRSDADW